VNILSPRFPFLLSQRRIRHPVSYLRIFSPEIREPNSSLLFPLATCRMRLRCEVTFYGGPP
jgi:hypothetical protein